MAQTPELIAAIGPRVRTSPFLAKTIAAGLTSVSTYNHMWLPMSYGDPDAEYDRLINGVSMWDVAAQRHIEIAGPDADSVVQLLSIVDTSELTEGCAGYAPLVDYEGVLINDPIMLHMSDNVWRLSIADSDVRLWIEANIRLESLDCTVRELPTATLAIQGPLAGDVISALGAGWARELDNLCFSPGSVAGIDVTISASGWSTQGGYELFLDDPTSAAELWGAVSDAGSSFGIGPGAPNPSERIENVLLSYGTDTGYDANPYELGLGDLANFEAGPFIGSDALARIRDNGPERQLLGVLLDGPRIEPLDQPCPASIDGRDVGQLRAAAWSPRFETNLGLALVSSKASPGQRIEVADHADLRSGELVTLPFDQ